MPCNYSGWTDPASTKGWGVVDFDWSNAKQVWAKSKPMNDEELLFQQVQMTTSASPDTTVWVYRCSVYAYPWYTSVRTILDDPAYAPWFINFKPVGPWYRLVVAVVVIGVTSGWCLGCVSLRHDARSCRTRPSLAPASPSSLRIALPCSPKCDNNYDPPLCSNYFHMQEQTPGYPTGDGDCAAPGEGLAVRSGWPPDCLASPTRIRLSPP